VKLRLHFQIRLARRLATGLRRHVQGNFHSEFIIGITPVGTRERNCLLGCPSHPHPDEVTIANDPVCGIEFYPASQGRKFGTMRGSNLHPDEPARREQARKRIQ